MGQTSSHKHHARSEYIKSTNLNSANYLNNSGANNGSNFSPTLDFNYQQEELIEDEEVNGPTLQSKSSYVISFYSKLISRQHYLSN